MRNVIDIVRYLFFKQLLLNHRFTLLIIFGIVEENTA